MRVLVHFDRPELFTDLLTDRFADIELACCRDYASLGAVMADFRPEALFVIKFEDKRYPRDPIFETESLKWVSIGGAGVDHVHPWNPNVLTVTNGAGVASDVMADYAIAAITALSMRFPIFARQQQRCEWKVRYVASPKGKTLSLVGLGHVGRAIARRAATLELKVVGTRANPQPTEYVDQVFGTDQLLDALALGDFVVISAPLLAETQHLIDEAAFAAMKDGAYFIDISRGGVVKAEALITALQNGKLAGAVLDVFEQEPMPDDCPIWSMENVLVTPHTCAIFEGWERKSFARFCDNLERYLAGQPLHFIVDPARGY